MDLMLIKQTSLDYASHLDVILSGSSGVITCIIHFDNGFDSTNSSSGVHHAHIKSIHLLLMLTDLCNRNINANTITNGSIFRLRGITENFRGTKNTIVCLIRKLHPRSFTRQSLNDSTRV